MLAMEKEKYSDLIDGKEKHADHSTERVEKLLATQPSVSSAN